MTAVESVETAPVETLDRLLRDLLAALGRYDDPSAHAVIDRALAGHEPEDVVDLLFFPALRHLGDAWEKGTITVAQEHYASGLMRGRMLGLVSAQGAAADGPVAVLACTAHDRHDIGLIALDLVLRRQGWRIAFLGADTPVLDALSLAEDLQADVLLLCGTEPHMYAAQLEQYGQALAGRSSGLTLALAGRAAGEDQAAVLDGVLLALDPRGAARQLAAELTR